MRALDPLDPRRGVLEGADDDGVLPGAQPGRDAHLAVDERAGLEQVVGQQRGGRLRLARLLDGRGDTAVQVEAAGPPEPAADRLADQRVLDAEAAGAVLHEQAGGDRGVGGVEQVVAVEPGGVHEDGQGGGLAGDGGEVEHLHHARVEAIEAQADHGPDRLRQLAAGRPVGMADQLGEEERVAAGGRLQLRRLRLVAPVQAQQLGDRRGRQGADGRGG